MFRDSQSYQLINIINMKLDYQKIAVLCLICINERFK